MQIRLPRPRRARGGGGITGRSSEVQGRTVALPVPQGFMQGLAIDGKLGACVLSHLFRNFEPVHGQATKDTAPAIMV
jgi:hypothetical protein